MNLRANLHFRSANLGKIFVRLLVPIFLMIPFAAPALLLGQTSVLIVLEDGSMLKGTTNTATVDFDNLEANPAAGISNGTPLPVSEIASITLGRDKLGGKGQEIADAIARLNSPNYFERQEAERFLRENPARIIFKSLLEAQANHPSLEMRHRIARLLADEKTAVATGLRTPATQLFDILVKKNGQVLKGDLATEQFEFLWQGNSKLISSERLVKIEFPLVEPKLKFDDFAAAESAPIVIKPIIREDMDTRWDTLKTIGFEKDRLGAAFDQYVVLDEAYVEDGIRFFSDPKVNVVTAQFSFGLEKYQSILTACTHDTANAAYKKRFDGPLRFNFCMPGSADTPAGVTQVGLYAGRIDQAKDFVMQAFDAEGHVIATVEAAGDPFQFFGIDSSIPIAFVQIYRNLHLTPLKREKDQAYAIDNVKFSEPKPIRSILNRSSLVRIQLKSGELICCPEITWPDKDTLQFTAIDQSLMKLALDQVDSITMPNNSFPIVNLTSDQWLALLSDGSIVAISPGKKMVSSRDKNFELPMDQINAVWLAKDFMRLPRPEDFSEAPNALLVFPTCRIAASKLEFGSNEVSWDAASDNKYFAEFSNNATKTSMEENEMVSPQFSQIAYVGSQETQFPTIWLRPPQSSLNGPGVMLKSGEKFATGKGRFRISKISEQSLTVSGPNDFQVDIIWSEIAQVRF